MKVITRYELFSCPSTHDLNFYVSETLGDGWELYGNPAVCYRPDSEQVLYIQAVVQVEDKP